MIFINNHHIRREHTDTTVRFILEKDGKEIAVWIVGKLGWRDSYTDGTVYDLLRDDWSELIDFSSDCSCT